MATTKPLLQLRNVTKRFGGLIANSGVTLEVLQGEIVGIIGPNGAGKSTLFDVITGFYPPTAGEILFRSRPIGGLAPERINRLGIARTFQKLRPFPDMTALENVMVAALPRSASFDEAEAAAREALGFVGLGDRPHVPASGLSTGQRKRLELARAMVTRPALLLLDEVTGGIDQRSIPGLLDLVRRLRENGVTLMVIEHNMRVIMTLADRIIALHLGQVIAAGPPPLVAQSPVLLQAYFGKSHAGH
jgi:branched-chain amino acid transport system ATP-binding protein